MLTIETVNPSPALPLPRGALSHLGDIPVVDFLRDYWQQRPLLIRNAFPDFVSPVSPDELAGMAGETDAARLVIEKAGTAPWEVINGPLNTRDFKGLPESHWSLLVNDTEQLLPELEAVIAPFRFIPDWRIDDLMISFAVAGGSVGAHVDAYDVFLLQGAGQRRWQINTTLVDEDNFIPDIDLRVLREFEAEHEWVLNPGDMLYLPPGIAHHGVAIDDCMTYSIGFRAPSRADLLEDLLGDLLDDPVMHERFSDKGRGLQADPSVISDEDLERLTEFLLAAIPDRDGVREWLRHSYSAD